MKKLLYSILALLVIGAIMAGGAIFYGLHLYKGDGPLAEDKYVVIPEGIGLNMIARKLENEDALHNRYIFIAAARITNQGSRLKAGEYEIKRGMSARAILEMLAKGDIYVRQYTIPEGLTSLEIIERLKKEENLSGELGEIPAEGSLLPNTYRYGYKDDRSAQVQMMQTAMQDTLDELWDQRADNLPISSKEEALILASIIEKETGIKGERAKVAGVFVNRLRIGMPLQTDPTVIYALTLGKEPLGRALTFKDLRVNSPYNTYKILGLPPTPICNPGRAAIEAALNPEPHQYFYFVADGTGGHAFAKTLAEHNKNVRAWRKINQR